MKFRFLGPPVWMVAVVACLLMATALLPAVAQTPTPEQIEMFRNLPPEQQQAVMESMNRGGSPGAASMGSDVRTDRQLQFPRTVQPRGDAEEEEGFDAQGRPKPIRLKAGDTILLTLEIRQLERKAPEIEERERREQAQIQQAEQVGAPLIPGRVAVPPEQSQSRKQPEQQVVERSPEETRRLQEFRERVLRRNPYKLDKAGVLNLPEFGPIPLAGLTADEATQRLAAELRLSQYIVGVMRLPLRPTGVDALKPFGYDLFAGMPSTFAPATDIPVPSEYVIGPGDMIQVQLIGSSRGRYTLVVGRDGRINFPELGPVVVGGRRFDEVRAELEARVQEQMIGTTASIGMGELRSIRVFVLGDAETPGSYTVSGLSTITNALFVSGGVKKIGSLRKIQLKRNGKLITTLDLYDLLLNGDTSKDTRLLPGDVIFIPPVGATVGLSGQVRRPAIYELENETTAAQLVELGGGLLPDADPSLATLDRVDAQRRRITVAANLATPAGRTTKLQMGDTLRVPTIRPILEDSVTLSGNVHRPGEYQYIPGMRLSDVIPNLDELGPNADQRYVLVRRELPPDRSIRVFSTDLERALGDINSAENFELAPRDQIFVFDLESGRDRIIDPLLRELRMQSRIEEPTLEVSVAGKVRIPGRYPLEPGMRISDLLRAGGSLDEAAYGMQAELTRYEVINGTRQAQLVEIDLQRLLQGDPAANIALKPFDYLVIKEIPLWASQEEVEVRGEVRFPGRYPIHRGETMRSLLARAGGLTDFAFKEGAIFTREELKERERKQLDVLATRMESDLAQFTLMAAQESGNDATQALSVGQSLLANLREAKPVGRLVIDLERSMNARENSDYDIVLKHGDQLMVPRITQEVTVIGEVQSTTSHLYREALSRDDYIAMSGGLTPRADEDHIYVVRADGSVVARSGNSWFSGGGVDIKTGDTIVAPLDTERMRPLTFWTGVMQLVYQLAVSAAAINSFSN